MTVDIAVLGGGAWGTALGIHLASQTHARSRVVLYVRSPEQANACATTRENRRYLPGIALPPSLAVTCDLGDVRHAQLLIAATPVAGLVPLVDTLRSAGAAAPLFCLAKGFVATPDAAAPWSLPHQALAPRWPCALGTISGPTFAVEVARGLPTALVVAAADAEVAETMAALVRGDTLRAYSSDDLAGVEVGGAIKNVLAIAAGASDGLGFGDNARAALITRGLAEAGRLSDGLGGRRATMTGLAGLGDLVLTCTGDLSRNRRVGLALARGASLSAVLAQLGHVAEGVIATKAAHALAHHLGIDMPIVDAVYRVLYDGVAPRDAVQALLARGPGRE